MTSAIPANASAGDNVRTPRSASRARASSSAMPADQGPKLALIPDDALLAKAPGQPIEEGVGGAIGGLTEPAPYRCDRGGTEEEVQLQVGRPLRSNATHPRPSRRTLDLLRRRLGCAAGWYRSRLRHARCRPPAVVRPAQWLTDARHRPHRRHRPRQPGIRSRAVRAAHRCALVRNRWARVCRSAPDAGRRARPDIPRFPVRPNPGLRSPNTLRQRAMPAVLRSGCPTRRTSRGT